ncbi:MAG: DUF2029 domain-containing protein [Candidatus Methanomethylophilaceae archaeon]|nr:DUF2029 domain-containing protein [Candidatus Methanomethylophilaceae archaeon]
MELQLDEYGRYRLKLAIAYAVACIGFLIAVFALNLYTEVINDRYWKDANPLFNGEIPIMEYPPFALVFMAIPRLFGWTPEAYEVFYVIEVLVFMIIGLIYTDKLAEHFGRDRKNSMLAYSVLMVLLLEFVTDRYDIFPAVLTLMSFYYFVKSRYAWAFILIAIGMMTKLYPAMLFPIYFLLFAVKGEWKEAFKGTAVFIIATLAIVIPVMIVEPDMIWNFLNYHSDRPLQIESVAASLIYPLAMLGLTTVTITSAKDPGSFGSDNLIGPIPDAVVGFLSPLMVACVLAVCFYFAFVYRRGDEGGRSKALGLAVAGVMLAFIVFGKVFSAQYLIWVVPPVVFLLMFEEDMFRNTLFKVTAAAFIMTQADFVYNVGVLHGGSNINDLGMIIILIRNILTIVMFYLIIKGMYDISRGPASFEDDV